MAKNEAFLRAEKRIEEAKRSGATMLDLSPKFDSREADKLDELPNSLWKLSSIRKLDISGNKLTILPEQIAELSNLTSLFISRNQL